MIAYILNIAISLGYTVLDVVFLTSLYNSKKPINRYKLMVLTMSAFSLSLAFLSMYIVSFELLRQVIQFGFYSYIILKFSKDNYSPFYLSLPIIIAALLDVLVISSLGFGYISIIAIATIKTLLIYACYKDRTYTIKFQYLSIDIKFLLLMLAFILILYGNFLVELFATM